MTSLDITNGKSGLVGESVGLFSRLLSLIRQDQYDLLVREDGELTKYKTVEYLSHPSQRDRFEYIDEAAAFCEIVYAEPVEGETSGEIDSQDKYYWPNWMKLDAAQLPQRPQFKAGRLNFDKDLKIQVWVNKANNHAIIVFRGTTSGRDWFANLRWLTVVPFRALAKLAMVNKIEWLRAKLPQISDHYDIAKQYVPEIVKALENEYAGIQITAAGHSLGGGLAQLAAYSSPSIQNVFAFNPSPVAGTFCVPRADRLRNQDGVYIARVYEKGEVLAFARLLVRPFKRASALLGSETDLEIEELRFNFVADDTLAEHKMAPLRQGLEKVYEMVWATC